MLSSRKRDASRNARTWREGGRETKGRRKEEEEEEDRLELNVRWNQAKPEQPSYSEMAVAIFVMHISFFFSFSNFISYFSKRKTI